jgi:hypothetical protein
MPLLINTSKLTPEEEAELMTFLLLNVKEISGAGYTFDQYLYVPRRQLELLNKAGYKIDAIYLDRDCGEDYYEEEEEEECKLDIRETKDGYHYAVINRSCKCVLSVQPKE